MEASDALIVGEDFISEHYFTTDAKSQSFQAMVLSRRKEWDDAKKDDLSTPRSRYTEQRSDLTRRFISLSENAGDDVLTALYARLRTILGFDDTVRWDTARIGASGTHEGPAITVRTRGLTSNAPLVIIEAHAGLTLENLLAKDEKTLLRSFHTEDDEIHSVAALLSHLFVSDDGPQFALVLSGGLAMVTERERWLEGRYLAVDLQLVGERAEDKRGGEIDRALSCISSESLAPDAEGDIWWAEVIAESIKHTVGVSQDLREGVRLSIEIIANDVVTRRREHGLPPLPSSEAQPLAKQSLRFLYRILFLLYAEASPELGVLPIGEPNYERGYSLDRLRELTLVELASPRARGGTHIYDSLATLFRLVDKGHDSGADNYDDEGATVEGLTFRSLRADLFLSKATKLIDDTQLSNAALQQVLRHLLLSKQVKGRDRGFISYAQLGINQLGAVYEGLMSYTGFFAEEDLYEVAKGGDASKGSWVVPATRIEGISESDFVKSRDDITGELRPVVHERGTFVYRLAGRERQQSASYYSPEVLTRFVVGQALEELLDQNDERTPARDILDLTVCEPALGSGAFAVEAVQQLAEQYLTRRQEELGERIDPDRYSTELQKVKAYIALHQVYGVDLNATAVEFAEISLWLATMGEGLLAPWFGLHLRRGNSLVGARRSLIPARSLKDKGWLTATPVDKPISTLGEELSGAVHHFLLPTDGWGSTVDAKEAKELAPEALTRLKKWRSSLRPKPTNPQLTALAVLARRTDRLWALALRRLQIAESEIRRQIDVWGCDDLPTGGAVTREQIEESLADPRGAYQRLRRVMDAWCALWFWPLTDETATVAGEVVSPPSLQEWIDALQKLLGVEGKVRRGHEAQLTFGQIDTWDELGAAEETDLGYSGAIDPATVVEAHPWLTVCERVAADQGFFHWELDFAPLFAQGGFDLQVGNPPWVRPRIDLDSLLAEEDPWFKLANLQSQQKVIDRTEGVLSRPTFRSFVITSLAETTAMSAFAGDERNYPCQKGLQPDLYRCFMELSWKHQSLAGVSSLIHPVSHLTDEKAELLRRFTYSRLRRLWQFINKLGLFDIKDHKTYSINIYGSEKPINFLSAASLYHPNTVTNSLIHDGSGPEPGIKDSSDKWDVKPHRDRILHVSRETLDIWRKMVDADLSNPPESTRMVFAVNKSATKILSHIANATRINYLKPQYCGGLNAKKSKQSGLIDISWGPAASWGEALLHGSHLHVGTTFFKAPRVSMRNKDDWFALDPEDTRPDSPPITIYKRTCSASRYISSDTNWHYNDESGRSHSEPTRSFYRIAWRTMTDNTGERTLKPAIIPPGCGHLDTVTTLGIPGIPLRDLCVAAASLMSMVADFSVRSVPKSTIREATVNRLPLADDPTIRNLLILRVLRLSSTGFAYADLWNECFRSEMADDDWASGLNHKRRCPVGQVGSDWTHHTPLHIAADRRQAILEIDVLVALALGLNVDELCTLYKTLFPVLYQSDRRSYLYDINGRLVPQDLHSVWRSRHGALTADERTITNEAGNTYIYELPFQFLDREADMRVAYAEFERRLAAKKSE
ncbi:class I SAM-dependent DNA methyltransferase [Hoyosella rhizosphaerae]|uniref:site-specific DNA-methyltransferase (adenine-specific) n=1 Tax=Hoyosella rhizosphaerae TaxID=1755582 RepID=A0A916XIC7_9ACTN|nr:class I SAM-dependent DNA methyltransferase [Hoyosella rhizosphaerae]MBN4928289.1 class I SAM-dependent DNA methyltransferase [Hoyosella rhizosphaerae]GGC73847.1 restriction endonuclease subunit M [Hoyosella rhizosphaerae]